MCPGRSKVCTNLYTQRSSQGFRLGCIISNCRLTHERCADGHLYGAAPTSHSSGATGQSESTLSNRKGLERSESYAVGHGQCSKLTAAVVRQEGSSDTHVSPGSGAA